jgi:hypothetical protein
MGKRMKLTLDMPAFTNAGLQPRTVDNWSRAVVDMDALNGKLHDELYEIVKSREISFEDNSAALMAHVAETLSRVAVEQVDCSYRYNTATMAGSRRINGTPIDNLFEITLKSLDWDNKTLRMMLLVGTYWVMCRRVAGFMPGLNGNISIPGAVYTTMKLGVDLTDG